MKAIVQRVLKASVTVGEEQICSIDKGLCILLGISSEDTQKDADYMVRKILNLRVFSDENGRAWSQSVMDKELEVLCVSQFTLQCILKSNKPDFHAAMPAEHAQPFYNNILEQMRAAYKPERIKGCSVPHLEFVHLIYSEIPKIKDKWLETASLVSTRPNVYLACKKTITHNSETTDQGLNIRYRERRPLKKPTTIRDGQFGAYMQVHIQNDGPVTIHLESPAHPKDAKQLAKLEKQQQRKEKTRSKGNTEKADARSQADLNASSGAEGDVSSEREP